MAQLSKNQEAALNFINKCKEYGFTFTVRGSVVKIAKSISANSNEAFTQAESQSSSILAEVPMTAASSIWGTDGGSIGGLSAMQTGSFSMNKSGCSKRVINAINKLA